MLRLNHNTNSLNKLYDTHFSFQVHTEKLLNKENKQEKKSFVNRNNIISIDKMKNANKIINRKKKIDKIIYNSNKDTNNKKRYK